MEGIKNKMEILELKNNWNLKTTEMKNLNRMEMPEKRISEIEDKQTEIIQYEQQREKKIGKKVEQSLRDSKVLWFMLLESQKESSKSGAEKIWKKKCLKTT